MTTMRVPKNFSITLTGEKLNTRERVKYLGVVLDFERKFSDHIEIVCTRADTIVGATRRLLPYVNGPSDLCRELYYQVWKSVVPYASPVWVDAISKAKDAATFRKSKRNIDHYTMQLLTGHGIFDRYRVRINRETVDKCCDWDACPDDAEYVLLRCPRWAVQRTLENFVSVTFTADNIIALVSANDHTWGPFRSFCGTVMKARQVQKRAKCGAAKRRRR